MAFVLLLGMGEAESARPFDADDLVRLDRVSDPVMSPDGRLVAYTLRETDIAGNRGVNGLWIVPGDGSGEPRRLTAPGSGASAPQWAPAGEALYFLSARSGSNQVWQLPLAGGESRQVTDFPVPVQAYAVAP